MPQIIARCLAPALAAFLLLSSPAHAAWPNDPFNGNVPLCKAAGDQVNVVSVSDGAGGAIVAWTDSRFGAPDIYAQRVNSAGVPLWTTDGVPVCAATGDQFVPRIIADGSGGAIVVWTDGRSGTKNDFYAQRLNANGTPQWAANGVPVCTASGNRFDPRLCPDGAGGAIVAWSDGRGLSYDIYVQRLNASGAPAWALNGVPLCSASDLQELPAIATDGIGGAIVTWRDRRGGVEYRVYAQRVGAAGAPLWAADGIRVSTAEVEQEDPLIVSDGAGGAIVAWMQVPGDRDVYAQRLGPSGTLLWFNSGRALAATSFTEYLSGISPDGAGGVLVTWVEAAFGTLFGQRVDATGAPRWGSGTVLTLGFNDAISPSLVSDGGLGMIAVWIYSGFVVDLYGQRVGADGSRTWPTGDTPICLAPGNQLSPALVSDGTGGAIAAWQDARSGSNDVYAQRIEHFGNLGNPEPAITSVRDIPRDQGGQVKLSWNASYLDVDPTYGVYDYRIWRSVPPQALASGGAALRRGVTNDPDEAAATGMLLRGPYSAVGYAWELIGTQPSGPLPSYSFVAPTATDSGGGANPRTAFMVQARASAAVGAPYWYSAPDSGYSVDDLPPATPAPFAGTYAAGTTNLVWNANVEPDLAGYRLYRGGTTGFVPGPGNRIAEQATTGYVDVSGAPYVYKLTAVDAHGNESAPATVVPAGVLDAPDDGRPGLLALAPVAPNPVTRETALVFTLPREGHVRLDVLDVNGRCAARVLDAALPAGRHQVRWLSSDGPGPELPPGVYLVRLLYAGESRVRRVTVLR